MTDRNFIGRSCTKYPETPPEPRPDGVTDKGLKRIHVQRWRNPPVDRNIAVFGLSNVIPQSCRSIRICLLTGRQITVLS